ncbi:MAG: Gfo/Idh/MocA family oxidoreductase [Lentisphaerae bacterium]|mgnify:FL=1|jgi:predicted dehydrogenase|nr:Gfo/Idh/MocA family oxidoreductase [Lentisphaerota bacterium]MBT4814366.1 Gfo/Idh/MocA family oxidoreductase [Lentisphaerota bacterium]MBT5606209.1 Gfo/Idh/MocA family oxidoreductase [Lentisphaerota bacterium]MBT7060401.1 Gfo/Idh/MocA family oxidoreductase [Lentisphaerota bacterium]MBT7844745.1 Gfo/Idh/MocA family oxidoreductase [Lentisphaerota bacterium]
MAPKRFVIAGTGGRGTGSYAGTILREFEGRIEVAGLYDINPLRTQAANKILGTEFPVFEDFGTMLATVKPDGVIVTTKDCTHAEYVVQALEAGIPTFSEKPLCTTREQVADIRQAAARSAAEGYVTHNMRFNPDLEELKRRLVAGDIGDVLHIQFTETLDRFHGADYFRRWHRFMDNSAGLMVHKASHHFDVMNWFADSRPKTVTGQGCLAYYGRMGPRRGERCSTCPHADTCNFYADVFKSERNVLLYKEPEVADGYFRDSCVFDERIDIPDTIAATMTYDNGVVASYSLIAYASYESMRIGVEGTKGRLEVYHRYGTSWAVGHKGNEANASLANDGTDADDRRQFFFVLPHENHVEMIPKRKVTGGHGGADPKLREFLFGDTVHDDPLSQKAPLEDGIQAVLVGLSVNESIARNGQPIEVQDGP